VEHQFLQNVKAATSCTHRNALRNTAKAQALPTKKENVNLWTKKLQRNSTTNYVAKPKH